MTVIVISHLTRMRGEGICVAGIDPEARSHVRPVTSAAYPLRRKDLVGEGGVFSIGAQVDLGQTTPRPDRPEVEDQRFYLPNARVLGILDPDEYFGLLDACSVADLEAGFGADLERRNSWKFAVPVGCGLASLACMRATRGTRLKVDLKFDEKLQLVLALAGRPAYLSVTDLRFYDPVDGSIRKDAVADVKRRMAKGVGVMVMLGLARAWKAPNDTEERHWLQVNGICLEDAPLGGELGP